MLDRVSSIVLGLNGKGDANTFADYAQWEQWQAQSTKSDTMTMEAGRPIHSGSSRMSGPAAAPAKKKLSYLEAREHAGIEQRVEEAEQLVKAKHAELEDPANAMDAPRLVSAQAALDAAQRALDVLYDRWAELERKNN